MLERKKYLSEDESKQLREFTEGKALLALKRGRSYWPRRWMVIDFLLSTGTRASECRKLTCGNTHLGREPFVKVLGKGPRWREVPISSDLKKHMKEYLAWKELRGEPCGDDDPFFLNRLQRHYSLSGIQSLWKACCRRCGLERPYTIHASRHTTGFLLYSKSKNLRLVQSVLGHRRIQTTTIYAAVDPEEMMDCLDSMW